MSEGQGITLGEIGRRLDSFASATSEQFGGLRAALELRPTQTDLDRVETALAARVTKLESWHTWAARLGLGGLGSAALVLVLGRGG